jgi:hypothetical protein
MEARTACSLVAAYFGSAMEARTSMMVMTASSSTDVNPWRDARGLSFLESRSGGDILIARSIL